MREWSRSNRDKVKAWQKAYYQRNKDSLIQKAREYALAHSTQTRDKMRRWHLANHQYVLEQAKQWQQENRERYNKIVQKAHNKRRARLLTKGPIDAIGIDELIERNRSRCSICNKIVRKNASIDHIIPISKGGTHTWENVQLAHTICNSRRGAGRIPAQLRLAV